jgi:hypothetical protein
MSSMKMGGLHGFEVRQRYSGNYNGIYAFLEVPLERRNSAIRKVFTSIHPALHLSFLCENGHLVVRQSNTSLASQMHALPTH